MASWTSSMAFKLDAVLPTEGQKVNSWFLSQLWECRMNNEMIYQFRVFNLSTLKCKCKKTCIWSMNDFWEKQIQKNRNFKLENCQSRLKDIDSLGQIGGHTCLDLKLLASFTALSEFLLQIWSDFAWKLTLCY